MENKIFVNHGYDFSKYFNTTLIQEGSPERQGGYLINEKIEILAKKIDYRYCIVGLKINDKYVIRESKSNFDGGYIISDIPPEFDKIIKVDVGYYYFYPAEIILTINQKEILYRANNYYKSLNYGIQKDYAIIDYDIIKQFI